MNITSGGLVPDGDAAPITSGDYELVVEVDAAGLRRVRWKRKTMLNSMASVAISNGFSAQASNVLLLIYKIAKWKYWLKYLTIVVSQQHISIVQKLLIAISFKLFTHNLNIFCSWGNCGWDRKSKISFINENVASPIFFRWKVKM
jgi:hypothetical protein